jgi:isoleucyl-tRNA synthetase
VRLFLKQLWNTYAFLQTYEPSEDAPGSDGKAADLDRWVLSRLAGTVEEVTVRMEAYDATTAGRAIAAFVDDLSNWYVRSTRRRFWDGDPAAFATLRECLLTVAKLLAPFTPFVADEIYEGLEGGGASVHLSDWPEPGERDEALLADMAVARDTVRMGSARAGRRRPSCASRCTRSSWSPTGPSGRRSSASPTSSARSSTSRRCASSRGPRSSAPTR